MNAEGGAGGGGTNIHLEFEEMITISNKLKSICDIYTEGVQKEIKNLSESDFIKPDRHQKRLKATRIFSGRRWSCLIITV